MVLEKTLERPLDSKEIKSVKAKGNQPWIFIERTDAEAANTTSCEPSTYWKRPWCWERLKAGGEGDGRGCDGWMASMTHAKLMDMSLRKLQETVKTGKPGVLQSMGLKESDTTERLNNNSFDLGASLWQRHCPLSGKISEEQGLRVEQPCSPVASTSGCVVRGKSLVFSVKWGYHPIPEGWKC